MMSTTQPPTQKAPDNTDTGAHTSQNTKSNTKINRKITNYLVPHISNQLNEPWGDPITKPPQNDNFRILLQNPNGISSAYAYSRAAEIANGCINHHIHCLGLSETNLYWKHYTPNQTCRKHFTRHWKKISMSTSHSTREPHNKSSYQPGGTCTLIGGKWTTRIAKHISDTPLGRWSSLTLRGRHNTHLTIITAYRVCDTTIGQTGPTTAYSQQYTILRQKGIQQPNPRKQFTKDIIEHITKLQNEHHDIILMLDANSNIRNAQGDLGEALHQLGMVDLLHHRHPNQTTPETYQRGQTQIDYIFGTPSIANNTTAAGITRYNEIFHSDHRGVFIDLNINQILGHHNERILNPELRDLTSSNTDQVKKFQHQVSEYINHHQLLTRAQIALQTSTTHPVSAETLNAIDRDLTKAIQAGVKKSRRRLSQAPWNPDIKHAKLTINYWKLWQTEQLTHRDLDLARQQIIKQIPGFQENPNDPEPNLTTIQTKLSEARYYLKQIQKNAAQNRRDYLEQLVQLYIIDDDNKAANVVNQILHHETIREAHRTIRYSTKNTNKSGLNSILIPQPDHPNNWTTITDDQEITNLIIERNKQHFHQAHGTPFTISPLTDHFGWDANTQSSRDAINGDLNIAAIQTTEAAKAILHHISQRSAHLEPTHYEITADDLIAGFKAWRETTSTSPSGQHLGYYKSLLIPIPPATPGETHVSTTFFTILANLITAAIQSNVILDRWKKVTNFMIEKIPGHPRIDKLRVIHLFEADINLTFGILWGRRLTWNNEIAQTLGHEQWGSRSGRRSIDVVILKQLTYNIMHITKTDTGTFDNDAKACYDRIVTPVAMLIAQRYGMPPEFTTFFANYLQSTIYNVKTALGTSEQTYTSTPDHPLYGMGQGAKSSGFIWLIVSVAIISLMDKTQGKITFTNPEITTETIRIMDAFVDDTTIWTNRFKQQLNHPDHFHEENISQDLSNLAQWWEQLLHATGGKLELQKCFYYLLIWTFNNEGKAQLTPPQLLNQSVQIIDSTTQDFITIKQLPYNASHKTLGVHINPIFDTKDEYNHLLQKANTFAANIRTSKLNHDLTHTAYTTVYLSGIGYSLPATTFKRKQLDQIQRKTKAAILHKLGYHSTTPLSVVYGPINLGGIGIRHLYVEQGSQQVLTYIRHIRTNSELGKNLTIATQWYQDFVGTSHHILQEPHHHVPTISNNTTWLESLRQFLHDSECGIHINLRLPQPKRIHDKVIMDIATSHPYTTKQINAINQVRIHLQVETIADIGNTIGTTISHPSILNKPERTTDIPTFQSTNRLWPRQKPPGPNTTRIWKKFLLNHICDKKGTLTNPLGNWTTTPHHQRTHTYYDHHSKQIYIKKPTNPNQTQDQPQEYYIFNTIQKNRYTTPLQPGPMILKAFIQPTPNAHPEQTINLPHTAVPTESVPTQSNESRYHYPLPVQLTPSPPNNQDPHPNEHISFQQYLLHLPTWEHQLLQNIQNHQPWRQIDQLHQQGYTLQIVSYGHYNHKTGAFGWALSAQLADTEIPLATCRGAVAGNPITRLRTEATGRLSIIHFIHQHNRYHKSTTPFTVWNTSTTLQKRETNHIHRNCESPKHATQPDQDLIYQLEESLQNLPPTTTLEILHKDDETNLLPQSLKHKAKQLALEQQHLPQPQIIQIHPQPACPTYLIHKNQHVTGHELHTLHNAIATTEIHQHIKRHNKWTEQTHTTINWQQHEKAQQQMPTTQRRTLIKFIHDWLPVGERAEYNNRTITACQCCNQDIETHTHLFQCHNRHLWQDQFTTNLNTYLTYSKTEPTIQQTIIEETTKWLQKQPNTPSIQTTIGWHNFLKGYIASDITHKQTQYAKARRNKHTGAQWTKALIQYLWSQFFELWKSRNDIVHQQQITKESKRERLETNLRITALYNLQTQVNQFDRQLFNMPLHQRLNLPIQTLKAWLTHYTPIIKQAVRDRQQQLKHQTQDIRNFFPPNPT